jgi:uncharacterized hydrophobic protein (TIGR00271 family)
MEEQERSEDSLSFIYLLHDGSFDSALLENLQFQGSIDPIELHRGHRPPEGARVWMWLGDDDIRENWHLIINKKWEVGLLPHPDAPLLRERFKLDKNPVHCMEKLLVAEVVPTDMMECNEMVVLSSVDIGDRELDARDDLSFERRWSTTQRMLLHLGSLCLKSYSILTGKEQLIKGSFISLSVTMGGLHGWAYRFIRQEDQPENDGRLLLVSLAPGSVMELGTLLLRYLWWGRFPVKNLPEGIGVVQTQSVEISSPKAVHFNLDGIALGSRSIRCEVLPGRLPLLGHSDPTKTQVVPKEQIRMNRVPSDPEVFKLGGRSLPFFANAAESDFKGLFKNLRDTAQTSNTFLTLMVMSVLLAMTGLYANSAPVIIGAMILAPLMAPIISMAMGLARADETLLKASAFTLARGIGLALGCSIIMTWLTPLKLMTQEMASRTSPNLLDLVVAVISGAAGAYANTKEEVAKSLAGVAIAVALVPPLAVMGIGLGWAEWDMAFGSMLLFSTNLVGITLSASITFLVCGFAPFNRAKKGMIWSVSLLLLVAIPLSFSFGKLMDKGKLFNEFHGEIELLGKNVEVIPEDIVPGSPPTLMMTLISEKPLDESHVEALKGEIQNKMNKEVRLEVRFILRR